MLFQMLTLAFGLVLETSTATQASASNICLQRLEEFSKQSAEEILKNKESWFANLETNCPDLPSSLLATKKKSLEPCQLPLNSACQNVIEGWQIALKNYVELKTSFKSLPQWLQPSWHSIQTWWLYLKQLFL
jgi:hypothetical protein